MHILSSTVTDSITSTSTARILWCSDDHFACDDGRRCIPLDWQCDSLPHCPDGSDELHCCEYI